jgi:hypothetical protein
MGADLQRTQAGTTACRTTSDHHRSRAQAEMSSAKSLLFSPSRSAAAGSIWREYVANQQQSLEPLVSVGLQPTAPVHSERRGTCERSRIRSDRVRSRIGRDKGSACRRSLLQGSRISRARSRNCRAHSCSGRTAASSCRWSLGTRSSLKVMRRCNRINRCY